MSDSTRLEIKQFYERGAHTSRYQNLKVELRSFTGEVLFQAGGTWDQLAQCVEESISCLILSLHKPTFSLWEQLFRKE